MLRKEEKETISLGAVSKPGQENEGIPTSGTGSRKHGKGQRSCRT